MNPLFAHDLPFGSLVGVDVADPDPGDPREGTLHPAERAYAATLRRFRRVEWVAGRIALHEAARRSGRELGPVLPGEHRQPLMPAGVAGSVAHKRRVAVALVGDAGSGRLGVDVEELDPPRPVIAPRILLPEELAGVDALPEEQRWEAVLLRFAVKEAIYKAIHPVVNRYVGFHEARVTTSPLRAELRLAGGEELGPLQVLCLRHERLLIAAVRLP